MIPSAHPSPSAATYAGCVYPGKEILLCALYPEPPVFHSFAGASKGDGLFAVSTEESTSTRIQQEPQEDPYSIVKAGKKFAYSGTVKHLACGDNPATW